MGIKQKFKDCILRKNKKKHNREETPTVEVIEEPTEEETELHQRLVNALSSNLKPDEVRSEEVKALMLQRKLDKSRKKGV